MNVENDSFDWGIILQFQNKTCKIHGFFYNSNTSPSFSMQRKHLSVMDSMVFSENSDGISLTDSRSAISSSSKVWKFFP